MLASLFVMLVVGLAIAAGLVLVSGIVVKAILGLIFLPFRILGWLLFLPFLLVKGILGLVLVPVMIVVGLLTAATVALPLLPLLAVALLVWLLVRAANRPAAA